MAKVLIVDDDPVQLRLTMEVAARAGHDAVLAQSGREALSRLRADPTIGAVILDLVMPDLDGMAVLEAMRRDGLGTPVIVQTASSSLDAVVSATRAGAVDFFVKPASPERLTVSLANALRLNRLETALRTQIARNEGTLAGTHIVARAPAMDRVLELIAKAARNPLPVLIEGENGVGRQLVARAIHGGGDRAGRPFVAFDCTSVPAQSLDAALFGGETAPGRFAEAQGGTLFLDEIGELPQDVQARLAHALEHGEIVPAGASRPIRLNVRLIAATSRRLLNLARAGTFREDLYYRLNVFPLYVPPLRERREDIEPLAEHLLARLGAETGRRVQALSPEAAALLRAYDWPGNVRQLENALYRAIVLSDDAVLTPADFPQIAAAAGGSDRARADAAGLAPPPGPVHIDEAALPEAMPDETAPLPDRFMTPEGHVQALADLERDLIVFAISHHAGRMSQVARALGIGRSTLYRKLKDYGLEDGPAGREAAA